MKQELSRFGRCTRNFHQFLSALNEQDIHSVLDLGCGDGRTLDLLNRFDQAKRVGLDIDMRSLKKARGKCAAILASGRELPFSDNAFDLIVEFHALHHIPDYTKAVSEAYRCLRKGGYFLMVEAVNDNPVFQLIRDKHPITKDMPVESNFTFKNLMDDLEKGGFVIRNKKRFGFFFEFTIGGIPHMPSIVKRFTSIMDESLERIFGTKFCASCVVLAQKKS